LVSGVRHDVALQSITVKYDALAAKQIGNRLDAFVIVNFRLGATRHRKDVHADLLRANISADAPEP